MKVLILNKEGAWQTMAVLEPFFRTVAPALEQNVDEITMTANLSDSRDGSILARKGTQTFQLTPDPEFHPFVSSSRLRILSGMSIVPTEEIQQAMLPLEIDGQHMTFNLTVRVEHGNEILTIHPVKLDVQHAKKVIRDDTAGIPAWMWAAMRFAEPENRDKVTFNDLLMCLKRRGSPAASAALLLYQLTNRPGGNQFETRSLDYDDWLSYLSESGFLRDGQQST